MKKLLLISLSLLMMAPLANATHLLGGEITWKCIKSGGNAGKYIFTMKLYRQCGNTAGAPSSASVSSNSPAGTLNLPRRSFSDISLPCYLGQEIDCYTTSKSANAIEEHIYDNSTAPVTLSGVPPAGGWYFRWESCCRPNTPIVDNLQPQNQSYRLEARMYPYLGQNANPCYDSSPEFAERPATVICTDYDFNYNHNAIDADNDSLSYASVAPLKTGGSPVTYATNTNTSQTAPRPNGGGFIVPAPGFSAAVPLPWSHPNMDTRNKPMAVDPFTGEINFKSYTPGSYATSIQVNAYKCGYLVATIFRDIPAKLIKCSPLPAPFSHIYNSPPTVTFTPVLPAPGPASSNLNVTVLAGEYVEFEIQSTDPGLLPGLVPQTMSINPSGKQFGAFYTDTLTGCPDTPCAVMDTANSYYNQTRNNWQGVGSVRSAFKWRTDCNHLAKQVGACFIRSNVYSFVFKVLDNYCPAPGTNFITASVTINAPDPLPPPDLKCVSILPGGDVSLSWNVPVPDSMDTANSFRKYVIYRANTRGAANYTAIDSFTDPNVSSYIDVGANAHTSDKFYYILGVSSCNNQSQIASDTLGAMRLTGSAIAGGDSVDIDWVEFLKPGQFPATAIGQYYIWQIYNGDTLLVDSSTSSNAKFSMNSCLGVSLCFPSNVSYFIEVRDTTAVWGCNSYSNTLPLVVGDNTPPTAPVTQVASVDSITGDINISWDPSVDCDPVKYYIHENGVIIDSVTPPQTTYSVPSPTGSNYNIPPTTYAISARDSCGNTGNPGLIHKTMEASIVGSGVIRCETSKQIPITFGGYEGWPASQYILFADSGTGFYQVASFTPPYTFPITYYHTQVGSNFYTYKVRAYDGFGTFSESSADSIQMTIVDGTVIAAPDVRCINVDENGNIRIEWIKPPNTSDNFDSYIIEHSTDGANFSVLDSITGISRSDNKAWDSTGYTHTGANPSTKHYYRVFSRSGCFGFSLSAPSNTIQLLQLDIDPVSTSVNQLSWEFTPLPTSGTYEVYREYPIGTGFVGIANLPNSENSLYDSLITCNDTVNYQVTIQDLSGCSSSSAVVEGIFKDNLAPAKQFLDSVSVQDDTNTVIGWSDNPSPDVVYYYVIRQTSGGGFIIDDTIPASQLSYLQVNLKGCFAIVAGDSCGNNGISEEDFNYHCTMETSVEMDRCDQSFLIQWNHYKTFVSGEDVQYEVFASLNGGAFNSIGTTKENNFRFSEPVSGNNYCFYVKATENEGNGPFTSTSDSVCQTAQFLIKPEYTYLQHVTVVDSNQVELSVWVDVRADVAEYQVKRGLDSANMKVIKTIQVPPVQTQADYTLKYVDATARTSLKTYYYKVEVIDPCGENTFTSNYGKNILLAVKANNESKSNKLTWTEYMEWESGVQSYEIFRSVHGDKAKFLASVQPEEGLEYLDDVSDINEQSEGLFCYYVEAEEGTPLFPGLLEPERSRSNEVCVIQYPLFYVPSAFTPGQVSPGLNDVFKPEGVFVDLEGYSFEIFNRWGDKVFSTNDFTEGWDGTIESKDAPTESYVYFIKYKSADGKEFQQKGTVTLTR